MKLPNFNIMVACFARARTMLVFCRKPSCFPLLTKFQTPLSCISLRTVFSMRKGTQWWTRLFVSLAAGVGSKNETVFAYRAASERHWVVLKE